MYYALMDANGIGYDTLVGMMYSREQTLEASIYLAWCERLGEGKVVKIQLNETVPAGNME